jgi:hypothetical protein
MISGLAYVLIQIEKTITEHYQFEEIFYLIASYNQYNERTIGKVRNLETVEKIEVVRVRLEDNYQEWCFFALINVFASQCNFVDQCPVLLPHEFRVVVHRLIVTDAIGLYTLDCNACFFFLFLFNKILNCSKKKKKSHNKI